jgi:hypothetical protein
MCTCLTDDVLREDTVENFIHLYEIFQKQFGFVGDGDRFESTLKKADVLYYASNRRACCRSIYTIVYTVKKALD